MASQTNDEARSRASNRPDEVATAATDRDELAPLTAREQARAEKTARRLHDELARLVEALPVQARGATSMAKHLSLVRNTCQRVVTAVSDTDPGPRLLARLPGIQGLRQFTEAIERADLPEADIAGANAAIDQFEALIIELAGSQSKLIKRLEATAIGDDEPAAAATALASEPHRRQLFNAAYMCTGRQLEANVAINVFRLPDGDPGRQERCSVNGLIGHRARPDGMPVVLRAGRPSNDGGRVPVFDNLDTTPARGLTPQAILTEFSTSPVPVVTSRREDGSLFQTIDPEITEEGLAVDIILGHRSIYDAPDARTRACPLSDVWALVSTPARHLVMDIYLERELAGMCLPTLDAQLWGPDLHPEDPWSTRLPHVPRLELLGFGLHNAQCAGYARHAELTRYVFDQTGWDPAQFVGYRCEVAYPIWRAGYCMAFRPLS